MDIFQMVKLVVPVVTLASRVPWERLQQQHIPTFSEMVPEELKLRALAASNSSISVASAPPELPHDEDEKAPCETCAASITPEMHERAHSLAEKVKAGELITEDAVEQLRELRAPAQVETVTVGVSNEATLAYQVDHLLDELNLIETHLTEEGKIGGQPCDCISKAGRRIKAYAQETIPIAARQGKDAALYAEIAEWGRHMQEIGTPEEIATGKYNLLAESGVASNLRKALSKVAV
ncbi:MAG: hypothetical protein ABIH46_05335 [Chloroflexota bacterium]